MKQLPNSIIWLLSLCLIHLTANAELETGLGATLVHIPHYLGSNEAEDYLLPVPYIRYRSERLNIDRNLVQTKLFQHGKWNIELSFGGAVAVDSDKSDAREGMDDLGFIGEMGPALQYHFRGNRSTDNALYLTMPIRGAVSTDFTQAEYRGYSFNPQLIWRRSYPLEGMLVRSQVSTGLRSASSHMHDYIYGVDAEFANADREAYRGKSGYGGFTFSYSSSIKFEKYIIAGFVRYGNISGASFEDSPLVKQNSNLMFGIAWAYLFN